MLCVITKILVSVALIAILGAFVYLNVNKSYATPYTHLSVPLTEDEHQYLPNQLAFHMDNQSNGGAVEVVSNETGQNVTQYFKYNPDKNSVTVSNSTMTADFAIQVPDLNDPNTIKLNKIYLPLLDVLYIIKHNSTDTSPAYMTYFTSSNNSPISIGNTTYNGFEIFVNIPNDRPLYQTNVNMFLHP
jgi:hypothetical protein